MGLRLLTIFLGAPLMLGALWFGGPVWLGLILVVTGLGLHEFRQILVAGDGSPAVGVLYIGGLAFPLAAYISIQAGGSGLHAIAALGGLVLLYGLARQRFGTANGDIPVQGILLGVFYVGFLSAHLVLLREVPDVGRNLALLTVLGVWATDSGAYLIGRLVGGPKLAPRISPNKTRSGALGGLAAGTVTGALLAQPLLGWTWVEGLLLGVVVAAAGQLGDLAESALKRRAGVKDTGSLLPGHGGVLDRFDSLFFAGPAALYLVLLLMGRVV